MQPKIQVKKLERPFGHSRYPTWCVIVPRELIGCAGTFPFHSWERAVRYAFRTAQLVEWSAYQTGRRP